MQTRENTLREVGTLRFPVARAPLSVLLIGQIAGYNLARATVAVDWPVFRFLLIALGAMLLVSQIAREHNPRRATGAVPTYVLMLLLWTQLAALHYQARVPRPDAEWATLPAREAQLELELIRFFFHNPNTGTCGGLARICADDLPADDLAGHPVSFGLQMKTKGAPPPVARNTRISAIGALRPLRKADATDGFEAYLLRNEIHFRFVQGWITQTNEPAHLLSRFASRAGARLRKHLYPSEMDPDAAGILVAMFLGEKRLLPEEDKDRFLRTGTMHLFAISGMHIMVVGLLFERAFSLLRSPRWLAALLALVLVAIYVEITGRTPSGLRALAMLGALRFCRSTARRPEAFSGLVLSAVTVLAVDPVQLFSAGFQLSYAVVAAIIIYGLPLKEHAQERLFNPHNKTRVAIKPPGLIRRFWQATLRGFVISICISLSASLASAPLSLAYFGLFSGLGILLNALLIPLASFAVTIAVIASVFFLTGLPACGDFLIQGGWLTVDAMRLVLRLTGDLPAHCLEVGGIATSAAIASSLAFLVWSAWLLPAHRKTSLVRFALAAVPTLLFMAAAQCWRGPPV